MKTRKQVTLTIEIEGTEEKPRGDEMPSVFCFNINGTELVQVWDMLTDDYVVCTRDWYMNATSNMTLLEAYDKDDKTEH